MGFRFFKRVKLLPGVSLNFSKSGVSTTIGPRGAKVTFGNGKVRETVGIPGTGISYTSVTPTTSRNSSDVTSVVPAEPPTPLAKAASESGWATAGRVTGKVLYWASIGIIIAAGTVLIALLALMFAGGSGKRRR